MFLKSLAIKNLRNITTLSLDPGERFNLIYGPNGSGKSSILEAIYFLGRGRSFRSSQSKRVIQRGSDSLTLFARNCDEQKENRLGIQLQDSVFKAKLNGQFVSKSSDLASFLPLLLIRPDADRLISGSPRQRRRFLDLGLFHVEQGFLDLYQRYNRILLQRNSALRLSRSLLKSWDAQFIEVALLLDQKRKEYVSHLSEVAKIYIKELAALDNIDFTYQQGWGREQALVEALEASLDSDIKSGFTQKGPHRADLVVQLDGRTAADYLSGGQLKLASAALIIAQGRIYAEKLNQPCVILIDDLAAELDSNRRERLLDLLYSLSAQTFITATDGQLIDRERYPDLRVFHVEQGTVIPRLGDGV